MDSESELGKEVEIQVDEQEIHELKKMQRHVKKHKNQDFEEPLSDLTEGTDR